MLGKIGGKRRQRGMLGAVALLTQRDMSLEELWQMVMDRGGGVRTCSHGVWESGQTQQG